MKASLYSFVPGDIVSYDMGYDKNFPSRNGWEFKSITELSFTTRRGMVKIPQEHPCVILSEAFQCGEYICTLLLVGSKIIQYLDNPYSDTLHEEIWSAVT